jgi:hypothetical protein
MALVFGKKEKFSSARIDPWMAHGMYVEPQGRQSPDTSRQSFFNGIFRGIAIVADQRRYVYALNSCQQVLVVGL